MGVRDWNFKQKPAGLWKQVLRAPSYLFKWHLGFLLGSRFILMTHIGRSSGRTFQTVVEVLEQDDGTGEYIVCSGTGRQADWYRNLSASPARSVQVGNRSWVPEQRFLPDDEAAERFHRYETLHPSTARRLLSSMGRGYDGTDAGRRAMVADMPMVAFSADASD